MLASESYLPMNLTFGVELEFVVRFRPADYELARAGGEGVFWLPSQNVPLTRQLGAVVQAHIIATLQNAGFDVNNMLDKTNYQKWTVDTDGSISWHDSPPSPGFEYYGIEVKSPAFHSSTWALTQIYRVVMLLRSNFEVFVNDSCALHVHVGNCHDGFPLQTLKNFCMLITVFERQFNMLHPMRRLTSPYALRVAGQFRRMAPFEKALRIDGLRDLQQLTDCYHLKRNGDTEGYMAYNFLNLTVRPMKTVEFRQHKGTLDPVAIARWAELAVCLIDLAHNAGPTGFQRLIWDRAYYADYTIIDLLHDLKLYALATYYEQRGIHIHPRLEWDWVDPFEPERQLTLRGDADQQALERTYAGTIECAVVDGIDRAIQDATKVDKTQDGDTTTETTIGEIAKYEEELG